MLPKAWRQENVLSRQKLKQTEDNCVTEKDRKARLLDDQWPRLWLLVPDLSKILGSISQLQTMDTIERAEAKNIMRLQLELFQVELNEFINSVEVMETLQEAHPPFLVTCHSVCCPPLPFTPYYFQYPPAVHLRLVIFCIRIYIRTILYPILRSESNPKVEEEDAGYSCLELCRTYAGVEDLFWDTQDNLLPCFSALVTAAFFCPKHLRTWLWYKLAHLESLNPYSCERIIKRLSIYWGMPDLAIEGFGGLKADPPERCKIGGISVEVLDLASRIEAVDLED
jgi:hypothetical protein